MYRAIPRFLLYLLGPLWLLYGCSAADREAVLVLRHLAGGSEPSRLQAETPAPRRREIRYRVDHRAHRGDLYEPAETARAAIVLVPGVQRRGKDDPRLVDFAETLARTRFRVLVPALPGLRELRIGAGHVQAVADALRHLRALEEPSGLPGRTGLAAFSYAAGPTLLAALRPGTRERVDFVLAIGGYHDLKQVVAFFTTGYYQQDGEWRHMTPNEYGKWVFVLANLERLDDASDRSILRRMAERRLTDSTASVDDLAPGLAPQGRALYRLLENRDPERTPALIAALPAGIRSDLAALDLADKDLNALRAHVILVHGRDDDIIPYTQSIALAERLPPGQVDLYLVDGLFHVDLDPGLLDGWRLWRAIRTVLRKRRPED